MSNVFMGGPAQASVDRRLSDAESAPVPAAQVPWVEKYRPDNLEKIHGHDDIIQTVDRLMRKRDLPNLLLHGPAGTGKTTLAVAICKRIFGQDYKLSTLELNASDERGKKISLPAVVMLKSHHCCDGFFLRGIDVVRGDIKSFAQAASFAVEKNGDLKIVLLDECDMMTPVAQFALRRMMEQ